MRLFVAIDFNDVVKEKICKLQNHLKEKSIKGRWKYIDNFHLTLKFLGEVEPNKITILDSTLKNICKTTEQFKVKLNNLGCFDGRDSVRVVWLGVDGEIDKLKRLNRDIEDRLEKIGFKKENRSYSPHITIAQDVYFKEKFDDIKEVSKQYDFEEMKVDKIVLMDSSQVGGKRIYTVIGEYELNCF